MAGHAAGTHHCYVHLLGLSRKSATDLRLDTADGGENWNPMHAQEAPSFQSVCLIVKTHGWALGLQGTIVQTASHFGLLRPVGTAEPDATDHRAAGAAAGRHGSRLLPSSDKGV
jgi:hypothetical protein